jgi:hypothetical protein
MLACALLSLVSGGAIAKTQSKEEKPWEISPYRVHVDVSANVSRRPDAELEGVLLRELKQRVETELRPWWVPTIEIAADPASRRFCGNPRELKWEELPEYRTEYDKLYWLSVEAEPAGYAVTSREFDVFTRRWGRLVRREVSQRSMLSDACFRALAESFSPLAIIEPTADDALVQLKMKAAALPRPLGAALLVAPGDPFLPLLRRTRRGGAQAGELTVVPWTFVLAKEQNDRGWTAEVDSALKNPFAARRRGMVEQVAVGLRRPTTPAHVRFFARSNHQQPLAGYEVFRQPPGGGPPELLGVTDRAGIIAVPPGERATTTLLLRSDGQVLAKLVVAAGAAETIEAPIADDATRLAAQAEVQAVREELVDVVARRAIMIARVKRLLKEKKGDEARDLMSELNDLPTPAVFASRIDAVRDRLPKSNDPRVRQTVDSLFSATGELLARFLDARTITSLQAEVNAATRGATESLAPGQ